MKSIIGTEVSKRRERMQNARAKNAFHIISKLKYKLRDEVITAWEICSTHTHRSPRYYIVSRHYNGEHSRWECTCPDFEANGDFFPCKHILYVQESGEV
jgi:tRNA U38,U39,U40 pseudouridine synthase TruA